ncbi:hypothetical protein ACN38_g1320 [Penicillium nordicum]|uniref:Uncharacterized protein n=1 Tax=Penicillium nordicum TaxID=229535 RepID=A0A0M9WJY7_9EURO|nr:hypothetical protein ACN38_g1320 [Penicillium nordicum]
MVFRAGYLIELGLSLRSIKYSLGEIVANMQVQYYKLCYIIYDQGGQTSPFVFVSCLGKFFIVRVKLLHLNNGKP